MITSLFICTRIVAVLASMLEILVHAWAHRKNAQNSNPNIYYRSPMHIMTSQFCPVCRNDAYMKEVIKLQDQRSKHWRLNLKDMARNIY